MAVMGISVPHLTLQLQGWSCSLLTKTKLFSCCPFPPLESNFTIKVKILISRPFFPLTQPKVSHTISRAASMHALLL